MKPGILVIAVVAILHTTWALFPYYLVSCPSMNGTEPKPKDLTKIPDAMLTDAERKQKKAQADAAVAKYKRLMDMTDVPAGMRQRAERMIVMLGD